MCPQNDWVHKKGYVDPGNLQFQKNVITQIEKVVERKTGAFEEEGMAAYRKLYQEHNYQEPEDRIRSLKKLLSSNAIRDTFELQ